MQQQRHYDYSGVTVAVKKKKKKKNFAKYCIVTSDARTKIITTTKEEILATSATAGIK